MLRYFKSMNIFLKLLNGQTRIWYQRPEVKSVSIYEYDEEKHMRQLKEEGFQEGHQRGIQEGHEKGLQKGVQDIRRVLRKE